MELFARPAGRPDLRGRVVAVTGGGRGLGRALALAFGESGADVALSYHESAEGACEGAAALQGMGRRVYCAAADARTPGQMARFVDDAARTLGGLDILVNNVGIFSRVPEGEIDEAVLDEAFAVNVKAAIMSSQAAAPHMRRRGGGAIVNVASLGGLRPWKSHLPYSVSKAALIMATECLALLLAPEIRVNAIAPFVLDSRGADPGLEAKVPLSRFGSQEEAVGAVMYLAVSAGYTTGEVLRIDGGRALA